MSRTHAALGIRQDTDIAVRCKLRALPATPRACSPLVGDALQRPLWMWLGGLAGVALIFAGMIVVQWQTPTPRVPAATGDAAAAQPEPQR
ncbi:hypothetical protein [Burkholderia contaminans]|uniref:hypothetical protein n=1 Tax=Burkholderia contaminans TaxID=488447 RepID=UPI00158ECAF1|nr:hypothetical protein [Burkholderia contaminans]